MVIKYLADKHRYYAKPEGQDPVGKLFGFGQFGLYTGAFVGVYDAMMYSRCTNALQFLNTTGYWVVPMTGMCLAFSTVTYISTNLRKKDDKINYVLGALAAGGVLHAWKPIPVISGWGTFFFVLYGIVKKEYVDNNYPGNNKNPMLLSTIPDKWYFAWRNVPNRDYNNYKRYEWNRESYSGHPFLI